MIFLKVDTGNCLKVNQSLTSVLISVNRYMKGDDDNSNDDWNQSIKVILKKFSNRNLQYS